MVDSLQRLIQPSVSNSYIADRWRWDLLLSDNPSGKGEYRATGRQMKTRQPTSLAYCIKLC